jgi:hypothetical protein
MNSRHESILEKPRAADQPVTPPPAPPVSSQANAPATDRAAIEQPLFVERESTDFRRRWTDVQAAFVDEPRRAVEQADALVSDVVKRLTDGFGSARATLEHQWDRGDNVTTEDLRLTLQRYRSFFDRLLAM